jgi:hypothetical protein
MISIPFEMTSGPYTYNDAIVLPDNHTFTTEEIEAIKQERFDRWLAMINGTAEA